jgi:hypothetical protein
MLGNTDEKGIREAEKFLKCLSVMYPIMPCKKKHCTKILKYFILLVKGLYLNTRAYETHFNFLLLLITNPA